MLNYVLPKVNGQAANTVLPLLEREEDQVPGSKIAIEYIIDKAYNYQTVSTVLPFQQKLPKPDILRPRFSTQEQVIHWLQSRGLSSYF